MQMVSQACCFESPVSPAAMVIWSIDVYLLCEPRVWRYDASP